MKWKDGGRLTLQVTCFLISIPVIDQPAAVHWPNHKACPVSQKSGADTQSGGGLGRICCGTTLAKSNMRGKQICDGKKIELRDRECCFYSSLLTDIRGSLPTRLVPLASSKGISNLAHGGADVYWISLFRGNWIKDAATAIPDFDQRREPRYWKLEYTKHFPADRLMTPRSVRLLPIVINHKKHFLRKVLTVCSTNQRVVILAQKFWKLFWRFWRTPSPLNVFSYSDHCQPWFSMVLG